MDGITHKEAVRRNLFSAVLGIFVNILYSTASRKLFVMTLGGELVGLSSLMGNITVVLSLLDFGAGTALVFRLYAPIAANDTRLCSAYLSFYRKLCFLSAILTFSAGLAVLPFVSFSGSKEEIFAFIIFLSTNSLGYLFSAERLLLFADQKNYVSQIFSYIFGGVCVVVEGVVLFATRSYLVYLIAGAVMGLLQELFLCIYIRSLYPEISFSGVKDKTVQKSLLKEILYVQPSNIAGTLMRTADNFLVVHLFGVATNGTYSNYNMLLGYACMLSVALIGSVSATVGSIGNTATKSRSEEIFRQASILSFFPISVCTCLLFVMSKDIVTLWLDKSYACGGYFPFVLALHFFVIGLKRCTSVFREGFGLYKKERVKPFLELIFSLSLSAFLGKRMGLSGIYLGQCAVSFVFCLWYEPYILYKYGFSKSVLGYYLLMLKFFASGTLSCLCAFALCRCIDGFFVKAAVCAIVPVLFALGIVW